MKIWYSKLMQCTPKERKHNKAKLNSIWKMLERNVEKTVDDEKENYSFPAHFYLRRRGDWTFMHVQFEYIFV